MCLIYLWVKMAMNVAKISVIKQFLQRHTEKIVPIIFIFIGGLILIK